MAEGGKKLQTFGWDWIKYQLGNEVKEENMQVVRKQQNTLETLKEGLREKHDLVRSMEAGQAEVRGRKKKLSTLDNLAMLRRKELMELQLDKTPAPKQNLQLPSSSSRLSGHLPLVSHFQPLLCSSPRKLQTEVTPVAPRKGILKISRTDPRMELQWGKERRSKRSRSEEEVEVENGDRDQVQPCSWGQGEEEQDRQRQYMEQRRKEELDQLQIRRRGYQIRREQQLAKKREEELEQQQRDERRRQQGMIRLEGHQSIRKEIDQEIARRQVEHEVDRRMRVEQERVREEQRSRAEEEQNDRKKQELDKERYEQIRKERGKQEEMIERRKLERERTRQEEEMVQRVRQVRFLLDQDEELNIASPEIYQKQAMNQNDVEKLKSPCQPSPFPRLAVVHSQSRREVVRCVQGQEEQHSRSDILLSPNYPIVSN